jgi:glutathione synthase/RimK-type ligase-like ATP-grasp enzyme
MKIAIHNRPGSYSDRWISYCKTKGIEHKLVNCYANDIIAQLADCDALMWHFPNWIYRDSLFAKQLIHTIEFSGKRVFPDSNSCWHYDDKIAQKYLLEAINAPMPPTYIFYSKTEALNWIEKATFPKVFKLRRGAASQNVKLVKSAAQARKLVLKAFGIGFSPFDRKGYLKERIYRYHELNDSFAGILKGLGRLIIPTEYEKLYDREKGYIYFQDYIPNNNYDIRINVIDNKAFGFKRLIRKNDFRASGSGKILYEKQHFPIETIKKSFELAEKLKSKCIDFDFVYDSNENPLLTEISYAFTLKTYDPCTGYWDRELRFHEGSFIPQNWMVDSVTAI